MKTVKILIGNQWHEISMNDMELEDLILNANSHLRILQRVRIEDWEFWFKPCEIKALEVIGD